jgi:hypothetical protein
LTREVHLEQVFQQQFDSLHVDQIPADAAKGRRSGYLKGVTVF